MTRYAIYYVPHAASLLWRFGSSVLGFDADAFMDVGYPDHPLFQDPAALAWTAAPRRYGFHATLKAPFHLAPGHGAADLAADLEGFASEQRAFAVDLKLASVRDFLALVTVEPSAGLQRLADRCVSAFDAYRAPLTASDRERRHPERLSERGRAHLDRWGYPFVFEDFRFHMTLTGVLDTADRLRLEPVLTDLLALVPPRTSIDGVALFRQDAPEARFRLEHRFPFAPA